MSGRIARRPVLRQNYFVTPSFPLESARIWPFGANKICNPKRDTRATLAYSLALLRSYALCSESEILQTSLTRTPRKPLKGVTSTEKSTNRSKVPEHLDEIKLTGSSADSLSAARYLCCPLRTLQEIFWATLMEPWIED